MVGDLDELYRLLSPRLRQIVRSDVRASEPVIEDACQIAWSRLIRHSEQVRREAALSWLATTAVREAVKLARRDRRELSLDAELERTGELPFPSCTPGPASERSVAAARPGRHIGGQSQPLVYVNLIETKLLRSSYQSYFHLASLN